MNKVLIILLNAIVILSSCTKTSSKKILSGKAQGTYYAITYFDNKDNTYQTEIELLLSEFNKSASNYLDSSIISKINKNINVDVDEIFKGNYNLANRISNETNGDFDITVRPLVQAWGFGSVKAEDMDSLIVDSILQFVGYQKVQLLENKIVKNDRRLQLDFDAIAQGYAVDEVCNFLRKKGVTNYLVDIGGEVYASKFKTDTLYWKVGVENPSDNAEYGENLSLVLRLSDKGLATSGNYRKFYIKDGIKYAHTINPHTGYPLLSRLLSATVLAKTTAEADAYATSFMVMGLEKSKDFLKKHVELGAVLISSDDSGNFQLYYTPNIENIIQK